MKTTIIRNTITHTTPLAAMLLSASLFAQQAPQFTDLDGDGIISAEEITQVQEALRAERLSQYDTDGNGELSRSERRVMKDASYDQALLEFDADGDGELSREERRASRDARRASIETQLDVNQDGEVSETERAGLEQVRQEKQDNHKGERGKGRKGGHRS